VTLFYAEKMLLLLMMMIMVEIIREVPKLSNCSKSNLTPKEVRNGLSLENSVGPKINNLYSPNTW